MSVRALRCPAPGSTLAVIAPAGPADAERVAQVPALLAAHGFAARLYPSCFQQTGDITALHCFLDGLDGIGLHAPMPASDLLLPGHEDVSEASYRVDRLLLQLRLSGALAAAAGFVLGSFTDSDDPQAVVEEYLRPLGKPVLGGWPAGHGRPNRPLPLGAAVTLDAAAGALTLDEDVLVQ